MNELDGWTGYKKFPLILIILQGHIDHARIYSYIYIYILDIIVTKILIGFKIRYIIGGGGKNFKITTSC